MAYTPTDWSDGVTLVDEAHLDHLEGGVVTADANATAALAALPAKEDKANKGAVSGYAPLGADQKVPAANLPAVALNDLSFDGDWVAGTYQEGDVVVKDGVSFLCVGGPTTVAPDPTLWGSLGASAVPPVVNGKWLKGVGGAMVWSDIDSDDILTGRLAGICKTITDWNAAVTNGWYKANAAANAPSAGAWYLGQVITHATDYVVQRVTDFTSGNISWYERRCIGGAWQPWKPQGMDYATSLPASAPDGTEAILVDSLTAPTYQWRFRYVAGISGANKWVFIGGSPAHISIPTSEAGGASTSYVDFPTPGPLINIPRAGLYSLDFSLNFLHDVNSRLWYGPKIGANATLDSNALVGLAGTGSYARQLKVNVGVEQVKMQYRVESGTMTNVTNRELRITPIAVA